MQELLFLAHLYFDFSIQKWESFVLGHSNLNVLFEQDIFARRTLRSPFPKNVGEARARAEHLRNYYDRAIHYLDPDYPEALEKLGPSRPAVVYLRGPNPPPESELIAIVGTRKPSAFGVTNAEAFAKHISARGYGVVSGLALGVDAIAHRNALPKYSLAILGAGFDSIYPRENEDLAEEIVLSGGTLLSQFPPEQVPLPINFPRRNSLIAALSAGVVVIEGSEKSGANITGKLALEMGSTVIPLLQDYRNSGGRGAIQLLELGATPVRHIEEALAAIAVRFGGWMPQSDARQANLFPQAEFRLIDYQKKSGLSLGAAIASLEAGVLSGQYERLPGAWYRRKARLHER